MKKRRKLFLLSASNSCEPVEKVWKTVPEHFDQATTFITSDCFKNPTQKPSDMRTDSISYVTDISALTNTWGINADLTESSDSPSTSIGLGGTSDVGEYVPYNPYLPVSIDAEEESTITNYPMPATVQDQSWVCNVCNEDLGSKARLVRHLKTHLNPQMVKGGKSNNDDRREFECILCHNVYSHKYNLKRHLKKAHNIPHDSLFRYIDYDPSNQVVGDGGIIQTEENYQSSELETTAPLMQFFSGAVLQADTTPQAIAPTLVAAPVLALAAAPAPPLVHPMNEGFSESIAIKESNTKNNGSSNDNASIKKFVCHVCQKEVSTKWSLKRHLLKVHKIEDIVDESTAISKREVQKPSLGFQNELNSLTHSCPICQKQFSDNIFELSEHLREEHNVGHFGNATSSVATPSGAELLASSDTGLNLVSGWPQMRMENVGSFTTISLPDPISDFSNFVSNF